MNKDKGNFSALSLCHWGDCAFLHLIDHLKNSSFNFICYYAQYITHPLKVSPCWASGTIFLLSIFSLLRIVLTPSYIPSKLKLHRPILSVCLVCLSPFTGYILGKSQAQPWLSLPSVCTWFSGWNQNLCCFWAPDLSSFYYQMLIFMWI